MLYVPPYSAEHPVCCITLEGCRHHSGQSCLSQSSPTVFQKALFGLQQHYIGSSCTARAPRPQSAFLQGLTADCQHVKQQKASAALATSPTRRQVQHFSWSEQMHGAPLSIRMCLLHAASAGADSQAVLPVLGEHARLFTA